MEILLVVATGLVGFTAGWFGRPRGVCQETGVPARPKKCPVHGDGGAFCGETPEVVIGKYHEKFRHMEAERDHFRGRLARLGKA